MITAALEHSRYMQYIASVVATLSMACVATHIFWTSPALPQLTSENSPIGVTVTNEEGSWIASAFHLGALPGSFLAAFLVEKIGRKKSLLLAAVPFFVPWILIIYGQAAWVLILVRFLGGFGTALSVTVCPMYIGEIAEKDIRGTLGTILVILSKIGSLFVLSVGPYVSYRALAWSCSAFPVVFAALFSLMPESPYYFIKKGNKEDARKNLIKLSSNNIDEKFLHDQLKEIEDTVDNDMNRKSTLWELLSKQDYRKSLIIILGITTLQQFSGLVAIEGYMQTIIESSESSISPEISSIIFGCVQLPAVLAATTLMDRAGRRPLLLTSCLGCTVALIAEGVYFYLQDVAKADVSSISWIPTTALVLYVIMSPIGIFSVPYVLLGELFATNIKGIAVSVTTFYGGILSFLVVKFFMPIADVWGMYTMFWIFAGCCILGALFVFFMLPETKGKTFVEIQKKLNKNRKSSNDIVA